MIHPPPEERWSLPTTHLGKIVQVFSCVPSTNDLALLLGNDPANHGLAFLAREQSAGRGQYGRTWQAAPDSSVLLSVLLFPPPHLRRPALLTAWAAVSVCNLIARLTGFIARIKWPNDVLLEGKKVCGILIEQRSSGRADDPPITVAGLGLNVRQPAEDFLRADLPHASSLFACTGRFLDTPTVARELVQILDEQYNLLNMGSRGGLEVAWQMGLNLRNAWVSAETAQGTFSAIVREVSLDRVILETSEGKEISLVPEMVRHLTPI